jgi:hypothetical protein
VLEVIDIDEQQRHRVRMPPCARQLDLQALLEVAVVEQAREAISQRELLELSDGDVELAGARGDL